MNIRHFGFVFGGRDYNNRPHAFAWIDAINKLYTLSHVVHGHARGADALGDAWAVERGRQPVACRALWDTYGRGAAGPMRNQAMLELLQQFHRPICVGFPGGAGTADMTRRLRGARIALLEVTDAMIPDPILIKTTFK